jgi:hypothetical protein
MHITIEAVLAWSPGVPIMSASQCELDRHIDMLSTSCVSEVEFNMHITIEAVLAWSPGGPIMKASQCELERHIVMLSTSCVSERLVHPSQIFVWEGRFTVSLCSPNEDFGRSNRRVRMRLRSTFQWSELSTQFGP